MLSVRRVWDYYESLTNPQSPISIIGNGKDAMPVIQRFTRVVSMERGPRNDFGRPVQTPAVLSVVDGSFAGTRHTVMTRSSALGGTTFLLRDALNVGLSCRLEMQGRIRPCEVVRSRLLSSGKHEIAVAFR
jgi:hypothetical protein